jgi:TonB family protein
LTFRGIEFASSLGVLHLEDIGPETPRLPMHPPGFVGHYGLSAVVHLAFAAMIVALAKAPMPSVDNQASPSTAEEQHIDLWHIVFIATDLPLGGGGGGGGNRQTAPIRHAEGVGSDAITLRIKRAPPATAVPVGPSSTDSALDAEELPAMVLDAKPLASGSFEHIGLPTGGVTFGDSTGPGSGGGVGTGVGTGIGPGRGPGIGPGSGGGIGGGAYRPGGAVTSPRVITEVKPTYTTDALAQRIQGTVVLELIVTRDGRPSQIRVIRSLDPDGLDRQAVAAAAQWRFEPGRLAGTPVDVLVTLMLDFSIR